MLFNTPDYFLFFGLLVGFVYLSRRLNINEKYVLLLGSLYFYAQWNAYYLILIYITITVDYFIGRQLFERSKIHYLLISLSINLGILFCFKYSQLFVDSIGYTFDLIGLSYSPPELSILLPVGISFYTFQSLSYTIDIYRQRLNPRNSYTDYALFVSFFPQLVAGPIIKARVFFSQLDKQRVFSFRLFKRGAYLIILGLCKKIVFADNLALLADPVFASPGDYNGSQTLIAILSFTFQIYFDFSGYTDIAIGSAMILGFHFPKNFNHPYVATSIRDFWRRWHISLSTWLRDYLYISMGGNRVKISHTHRNIMITMLLGGIWHGASWNFMIWGGLHGLYMVIERSASSLFSFRIWAGLKWFYTFTLVSLTWVLFRSDSFADSQTIYTQLFVGDYRPEDLLNWSGLLIIGLVLVHFINHLSKIHKRVMISVPLYVMIISVLFLMMLLFTAESAEPFIYFQF